MNDVLYYKLYRETEIKAAKTEYWRALIQRREHYEQKIWHTYREEATGEYMGLDQIWDEFLKLLAANPHIDTLDFSMAGDTLISFTADVIDAILHYPGVRHLCLPGYQDAFPGRSLLDFAKFASNNQVTSLCLPRIPVPSSKKDLEEVLSLLGKLDLNTLSLDLNRIEGWPADFHFTRLSVLRLRAPLLDLASLEFSSQFPHLMELRLWVLDAAHEASSFWQNLAEFFTQSSSKLECLEILNGSGDAMLPICRAVVRSPRLRWLWLNNCILTGSCLEALRTALAKSCGLVGMELCGSILFGWAGICQQFSDTIVSCNKSLRHLIVDNIPGTIDTSSLKIRLLSNWQYYHAWERACLLSTIVRAHYQFQKLHPFSESALKMTERVLFHLWHEPHQKDTYAYKAISVLDESVDAPKHINLSHLMTTRWFRQVITSAPYQEQRHRRRKRIIIGSS